MALPKGFIGLFLIVGIWAYSFALGPLAEVHAQLPITWSTPVKLSEPPVDTHHPAVIADPWGGVHIFWGKAIEGTNSNNMIYYTHWNGEYWSESYDLFVGVNWAAYNFPYALIDSSNVIHLLWSGYDGLYYSSVPALQAGNAQAWRPAQLIVRIGQVQHSRLAIDRRGVYHVVYNLRLPGANIMYTRSEDQGLIWSTPVEISNLVPNDPQVLSEGRIALDSNDNLHVVWSESHPPEFIGRRVFYVNSTDGGDNWTSPLDLSGPPTEKNVNHHINVAVDKQDRIHVVWAGGPDGSNRLYRFSQDDGETWTDARQIFGTLLGWGGWDTMISDPSGNIYWAGLLRYPQGFYFNTLVNGGQWLPAQILVDEPTWGLLAQAHFPQLAVSQGNRIHLVMVEGDRGPIWYMQGQTTDPSVPPPPTPTPVIVPSPTPSPTRPLPAPTPTAMLIKLTDVRPAPNVDSSFMPIIIGAAPAVFLVALVFLLDIRRFRR